MNLVTIIILAFSMSMDAFAVTLAKGVKMRQAPKLLEALRIGLIFGIVEAITPVIGWFAGSALNDFVGKFGHWIAFSILCLVGLTMICGSHTSDTENSQNKNIFKDNFSLVATAFATSIDAMAIGASLALVEINIWLISFAIGCCTFLMTMLGITLGNFIGLKIGKIAEILGGLCLIGIGCFILVN